MLTQIATGFYRAGGIEVPALFTLIDFLGFFWIVGWWLRNDSRKTGVAWIYDLGLFLTVAWPFVLPYHIVKSRGAKGLLIILGFVATYVAALIVGVLLYFLLSS